MALKAVSRGPTVDESHDKSPFNRHSNDFNAGEILANQNKRNSTFLLLHNASTWPVTFSPFRHSTILAPGKEIMQVSKRPTVIFPLIS